MNQKGGTMFPGINKLTLLYLILFVMLAACSGSNNNENPMNGDTGDPPAISSIAWVQAAGCTPGAASPVTISVTATDPDHDINDLTFSGSVSSCSGTISSAVATVTCPQAGQYTGNVTVTDPDGNTDSATFSFGPCDEGEVTN